MTTPFALRTFAAVIARSASKPHAQRSAAAVASAAPVPVPSAQRKRKAESKEPVLASPAEEETAVSDAESESSPKERAPKRAKGARAKKTVRAVLKRAAAILEVRKMMRRASAVASRKKRVAAALELAATSRADPEPQLMHMDGATELEDAADPAAVAIAASPVTVVSEPSTSLQRSITELRRTVDSFTKALDAHKFQNKRESFYNFRGRFESFLEYHRLKHVLITPAGAAPPPGIEVELLAEQQRTVYHMLAQCVPQEVLQAVRTSCEHTGYDAWKLLKDRFLGDEKIYVQRCEAALTDLTWSASEPFATFESQATSALAELELATGSDKRDHEKQSIYLRAIRNGAGRSALDHIRLNGVHVVHSTNSSSFATWLSGMREEARRIEDEAGAATQRKHTNHSSSNHQHSSQISAVDYRQPHSHAPSAPRDTRSIPCKNWARSGGKHCNYGDKCKFMHDRGGRPQGTPHGQQRNFRGNNPGMKPEGVGIDKPCWEFIATQRCQKGDQCRFKHTMPAAGADSMPPLRTYQLTAHSASSPVPSVVQLPSAHIGHTDFIPSVPHRIIADSGASAHFTPRSDFIRNLRPLSPPLRIQGALGEVVLATQQGDGVIPMGKHTLLVDNIILCEHLRDTLLSVVELQRMGHQVQLRDSSGEFVQAAGEFEVPLSFENGILTFNVAEEEQNDTSSSLAPAEISVMTRAQRQAEQPASAPALPQQSPLSAATPAVGSGVILPHSLRLAHLRYGHISGRKLSGLILHNALKNLPTLPCNFEHSSLAAGCDACLTAKMTRRPFSDSLDHHASERNDKAVADVCGPLRIAQKDGSFVKVYLSTITDVATRHLDVMITTHKSEASDHVMSYFHRSRITTGAELKHFHTDGGSEYNKAERALKLRGVKCTRTSIATPQHNAIAERKNRTILELTRVQLQQAGASDSLFWREAIATAVYVHNRTNIPVGATKTQHELWTGEEPHATFLHPWGCDAVVQIPEAHRDSKLTARGEKGMFVGYDPRQELCWQIRCGERTISSRDVRFMEDEFTIAAQLSNSHLSQQQQQQQHSEVKVAEQQQHSTARMAKQRSKVKVTDSSSAADEAEQNSDRDTDSSDSSNSSDSESKVDHKTARQIAVAEERAAKRQQRQTVTAAPAECSTATSASTRKSSRHRTSVKQTGLNLDDFGTVAFAAEATAASLTAIDRATPRLNSIPHSAVNVPTNRRAALQSSFAVYWQAAMDAEMESIHSHETYVVTPRPAGINVVGCRWVFAVKEKDGYVKRFKARLVARGFSQQHGVDYDETYSPVMKYKTLRAILAIVAERNLTLELMDVQTAYLNAKLKEIVYMQQPEGYEQGPAKELVCRLLKAIYGLKQAGREWNAHLNAFILSLGFSRLTADTCVYVKRSASGRLMILSTYVDDIPSAFDEADRAEWEKIKTAFFEHYKITFLGEADWFLNMRLTRDRSKRVLFLDQRAYINQLLQETRFDQCRIATHPGAQEELSKADCPTTPAAIAAMQSIPYRSVVGALTYLANATRPDIAAAVNRVAQFSQNPGAKHWAAVKQILRYLSGTKDYALKFQTAATQNSNHSSGNTPIHTTLFAYADASWGNCPDSRRSTTGWLLGVGGSWIDWCTKKQETVALSSCEAEYMALAAATQAILWMRNLLAELDFHEHGGDNVAAAAASTPTAAIPLRMFSDNKSAIAMAKNDTHHNRSKHIDIRHHFIRDLIAAGKIDLQWVSTEEQLADILTKSLAATPFARLRDHLVCQREIHTTASEQE